MCKKINKCFTLLLALILIATSIPMAGLAADTTSAKEYESFEQAAGEMTTISESFGEETYNVMTAHLKALDAITYDWSSLFLVGVSGTTKYANYGFQILYGTSQGANRVKLNENKGYGTYDGITVTRDQLYNSVKLEKVYADGIDIKVVRMNTWAYLLANMGEGFELLGRMYIPSTEATQFTLYSNKSRTQLTNITIAHGKGNTLAALEGMSMKVTSAGEYFPVKNTSWTVEGRLTADLEAVEAWESTDKRIAMVGTSTWAGTVAVNCQSGTWKGQGITSWSTGNIGSTHTDLLASEGMWVRWVREGNLLSLWTSADGEMWTRIVENSTLSTDAAGVYITNSNTDILAKLSNVRITDTSEYPSFELASAGMATITGSYGEETYNVMTGHLKALDKITYDWGSLFLVGVSGTTKYANYGFQILYGTSQGANRIKLNENKGYGTYDGITITRDQIYNDVKLEKVYADGIDVKIVRLDTWAYILADMGEGYELLGRMYIPSTEATQFTLYSNKSRVQMSNLTIKHGKENALEALSDMSMKVKSAGEYFPVNSTSWTVEGRLTADTDVVAASTTTDNRIAIVGTSTWAGTIAVNCQSGTWKGQGITNWSAGNISSTHTALLASEGMWVRWVREGSTVSLWTSADGKNWTHIVDNPQLSEDAAGVYIKASNDSYLSALSDVKISLVPFKEVEVEEDSLGGVTVSLGDNIGLNFYLDLTQDTLGDEEAYVSFKLPGENHTETEIMIADAKQITVGDKEYQVFSCGIAAKEMSSDVEIEVVRGDGTVVCQDVYSVVDYANTILTDTENYTDADRAMVKALLNYGSYAQLHFGHDVDNLANAAMDNADKNVDMPMLGEECKYSSNGKITGLTYYGTSLMLVTKTSIRHYFQLTEGNIEDITFTYGEEILVPVKKGTLYYVEITGIDATGLSDMYDLAITKGEESHVLTYGPYTYVKAVVEGDNYTDSTKDLMAALYQYAQVANEYKNSMSN